MRDYAVSLGRLGDVSAADEVLQRMYDAGASGDVTDYVQAEVDRAEGRAVPFAPIERHAFYARARAAYCVIATGESRGYGCFVFKKGVMLAPDAPRGH